MTFLRVREFRGLNLNTVIFLEVTFSPILFLFIFIIFIFIILYFCW